MEQFDRTQENLDELIYMSKEATTNLKPLINDVQKIANHLNSILSTIDDKETLNDVKLTLNAARSISTKVDNMSDDFEKLMKDKKHLEDVLKKGKQKASIIAEENLKKIREIVGFV